jgi:hypothetical protein
MITAQEGYFAEKQTYIAPGDVAGSLSAYGYARSNNVTATIVSSNSFTYQMTAAHSSGDRTWTVIGPGPIQ